jgi:hypothetical protein
MNVITNITFKDLMIVYIYIECFLDLTMFGSTRQAELKTDVFH